MSSCKLARTFPHMDFFFSLLIVSCPKNPNDPDATRKFEELSHAYDILSNPEKRRSYDLYGETRETASGSRDAADVFAQFFGRGGFGEGDVDESFWGSLFGGLGGGGAARRKQKKGEDIVYRLGISLELFYCGGVRKLKLTRDALCATCHGRGTNKEGVDLKCATCRGSGMVTVTEKPRPGYIVQRSSPCTACRGTGELAAVGDRCEACHGARTVEEAHVVEIPIEPGMRDGSEIRFPGEGSAVPGAPNGDLIVVLVEAPGGGAFHRSGAHLITQLRITLRDALLGFEKKIKHLDGHEVVVKSTSVIQPREDAHIQIEGEGMPIPKTTKHGDLYVQLSIEFPETISAEARALLEKALPDDETVAATTTPVPTPSPQGPLPPSNDQNIGGGGGGGIFDKLRNVLKRHKSSNDD